MQRLFVLCVLPLKDDAGLKSGTFKFVYLLHLLLCKAGKVISKFVQVHAVILGTALIFHEVRTVLCCTK